MKRASAAAIEPLSGADVLITRSSSSKKQQKLGEDEKPVKALQSKVTKRRSEALGADVRVGEADAEATVVSSTAAVLPPAWRAAVTAAVVKGLTPLHKDLCRVTNHYKMDVPYCALVKLRNDAGEFPVEGLFPTTTTELEKLADPGDGREDKHARLHTLLVFYGVKDPVTKLPFTGEAPDLAEEEEGDEALRRKVDVFKLFIS